MSNRVRYATLGVAVVVAGVLASLFQPERLLVAEVPIYARVLLGALAVVLWLSFLAPFWLPEVVPSSWPQLSRALRWLAGVVLLGSAGVALFLATHEPAAKSLWVFALLAVVFAVRHLHLARTMQRSSTA